MRLEPVSIAVGTLSREAMLALSRPEKMKLDQCETIIRKGIKSFQEVGDALLEIRNGRLYRQTHQTFEDYCQKVWAMGARRARQLAAGAEVVQNLAGEPGLALTAPPPSDPKFENRIKCALALMQQRKSVPGGFSVSWLQDNFMWARDQSLAVFDALIDRGLIRAGTLVEPPAASATNGNHGSASRPAKLPESERVARPLARLPKEQQREVWNEVVAAAPRGSAPTARQVEAAVAKRVTPKLETKRDSAPPAVLAIARKFCEIGTRATNEGRAKSWESMAEQQQAGFLAIAHYHQNIVSGLEQRIRAMEKKKPLAKAWPKPNAHGVYSEKDADVIQFSSPHAKARIYVMEIAKGWIHATSHEGVNTSASSPLQDKWISGSRARAILTAVSDLRESFQRLASGREAAVRTPQTKPSALKALAWLKEIEAEAKKERPV